MTKSWLYRHFGIGKVPPDLVAQLREEGLLLLEEGIKGSVTYIGFRAPRRAFGWKREWCTASIVLTTVRLVALRYSRPIVDVPLADERLRSMRFSLEGGDTLLVAFDAALFHSDWSGRIEYRFRMLEAQSLLDQLRARIA